ncbi:TetR/AcrR family transcriptional regulator [Kushneria konosiri]|uniref:TetR family transcriptional regulator n=1 Tax=Kushneria konosiri TaxID=698828 RepID=A0A2Z2H3C2_9GAMM|nr:TetR/AcrR family transcriptional regulator [Kushneria konosiri]ARS51608.1 TetR family transcriptional regulator [Kushneria konosiri]
MPASKRDHLMTTAEQLFHEQGFHATGIDRIVSAAGVVRMTLYNHFSSKEALILAVLEARHQRFIDSLDAAVARAPAGHATRALTEAHGHWLETFSQHGCIMLKAMGEFAEHSATIHAMALQAKLDLLRRIESAVHRDGMAHASSLARQLFTILEGSNNTVAVLGVETALSDTRAMIDMVIGAAMRNPS